MKNSKILTILMLAFVFTAFTSCSDDDDDTAAPTPSSSQKTIADLAIANDETDSLVVALSRAGLVTTFQNAGNYTVFAPNNAAFRAFLSAENFNSISDIPVGTLESVLKYHVLNTEVKAANLTDNTYGVTLNTASPDLDATVVEVDVTGGVKLNNNASVETPDIDASNGVIHIIDKVITTKNVVELAINDERFSSLVAALTAFNFGYTTILSGTGPFTVFAPTNQAFDNLIASNAAWNSLSDIDSLTLAGVLTYHVVNGSNVQSSELKQGDVITTLNTGTLSVDLSNGAQLITGNTMQAAVNIIVTDVQGNNGVIHAVEEVLLPQ